MIPKSIFRTMNSLPHGAAIASATDMPDDVKALLMEIAALADISPEEQFVCDLWGGMNLATTAHTLQQGGFRARRRIIRDLARVAKAGNQYASVLRACSSHAGFLLSIVRPHLQPLIAPDLSQLANVIGEISSATEDAIDTQSMGWDYLPFKLLVFTLVDAAERSGGKLSLNDAGTGTLVDALDKLRDARWLPKGLIPKNIAIAQLRRARDVWSDNKAKTFQSLTSPLSIISKTLIAPGT
jgi:hypothetical protein